MLTKAPRKHGRMTRASHQQITVQAMIDSQHVIGKCRDFHVVPSVPRLPEQIPILRGTPEKEKCPTDSHEMERKGSISPCVCSQRRHCPSLLRRCHAPRYHRESQGHRCVLSRSHFGATASQQYSAVSSNRPDAGAFIHRHLGSLGLLRHRPAH